jgi:hypothetical protein
VGVGYIDSWKIVRQTIMEAEPLAGCSPHMADRKQRERTLGVNTFFLLPLLLYPGLSLFGSVVHIQTASFSP